MTDLRIISCRDFDLSKQQLITIRKTTSSSETYPAPSFVDKKRDREESVIESPQIHIPAHKDFRQKYFQGFRKPDV